MKSKITIVVLIILLFISGYFNFRNYRNKNQEERAFLNFSNTYISRVYGVLESLQNFYSTGNYQQFEGDYNQLIKELYLLDQFLKDGSYFLNKEIDYMSDEKGFKHIAYTLEGGLKDDGY